LEIYDSAFIDNVATRGGAIYIEEGALVINDSTFDTNAATFQAERLKPVVVPMWRSTTPPSRATLLPM
jgi:predicted outer membrane repeat protein